MKSNPFQVWLQETYQARKKKNPRYSLRSFSKELGMNPSTLSRIVSGTRGVSLISAKVLIQKLKVDEELKQKLALLLVGNGNEVDPDDAIEVLTPAQCKRLAGWEFTTIQALLETNRTFTSSKAIAKSLNISLERADFCLHILQDEGWIRFTKGRWESTLKRTLSIRKDNPAVSKIIEHFLAKSLDELRHRDSELHSFSGIVMPIDPALIPEVEEKIFRFRSSLGRFLSKGKKTQVYRLNVQFFPLSQ